MKPTEKSDGYPIFEANQVLSHSHLNRFFDYLDEQERLTRANLIGIGIVCGLEISLSVKDGAPIITVSKGCGITSEGYLIVEPEDNVELALYRDYAPPGDVDYSPFFPPAKEPSGGKRLPYDLQELVPKEEADEATKPLADLPDLGNKAVLMFLELKNKGLRNCSPDNCDDKGSAITATVRRLLISKSDLDKIIEAKNLKSGPYSAVLADALKEKLGLDDIRLPRYDVPNTGLSPATTIEVLTAFQKVFVANELATKTRNALTAAYKAFKPAVREVFPEDPFSGFTEKFGFLDKPDTPAQLLFLQYYYDFFDDLLKAYEEFRRKGVELLSACCPPADLFPRHLMLGTLAPETETTPSSYRQQFWASPAINHCKERTNELRLLFQRLVGMVTSFTNNPPLPTSDVKTLPKTDMQIRITPSKFGGVPLSDKAIPYYYLQDGDPPLYQLWNAERTRRNRANQNPGYHSDNYTPPAPPFVTNALRYDLEPYDFLRIEGHLGKRYQGVLKTLSSLINEFRLPIGVIAISTGKAGAENLQEFLQKHPGMQHKAGVPLGGTFILVYRGVDNSYLHKKVLSETIPEIDEGMIITDFFLPYRIVKTDCQCSPLIRECEYEWIDSVRHINNLSLRDYRPVLTAKAPPANEKESARLRNSYVIRIYKYEIQGRSQLPGNKTIDIVIPISDLKTMKLSAVVRKLNETFPFGLVFDHKPSSDKILIRHMEGHNFRIELGGIQGNQIRYAYEHNRVFRWQDRTWEELTANFHIACRTLGGEYKKEEYGWLHENHKPQYPASVQSPTAKEAIEWEKTILARARRYSIIDKLPIYKPLLLNILKEIKKIDPYAKVVLIGSWANGSWISRVSGENNESIGSEEQLATFLALREKVTGKTGYSDIDLLVESDHGITADMIKISTGYKLNILRGKKDAQKGLVLAEK